MSLLLLFWTTVTVNALKLDGGTQFWANTSEVAVKVFFRCDSEVGGRWAPGLRTAGTVRLSKLGLASLTHQGEI